MTCNLLGTGKDKTDFFPPRRSIRDVLDSVILEQSNQRDENRNQLLLCLHLNYARRGMNWYFGKEILIVLSSWSRCGRVPEARCMWRWPLCQHHGCLPVWILRQWVPHDPERPLWGWVGREAWDTVALLMPSTLVVKFRAGPGPGRAGIPPGSCFPLLSAWHWHLPPSALWSQCLASLQWFHLVYFPSWCSLYFSPQYLPSLVFGVRSLYNN